MGGVLGVAQRILVIRLWKLVTPVGGVCTVVLLPYRPQVVDEGLVKEKERIGWAKVDITEHCTYGIFDSGVRAVLDARSETVVTVGTTLHFLPVQTITIGSGIPTVVTGDWFSVD